MKKVIPTLFTIATLIAGININIAINEDRVDGIDVMACFGCLAGMAYSWEK